MIALQFVMFAAGLVALYFGAEWLVRGAARLARLLGTSALVIGLTVVALGTSAPELVVTGLASFREQGELAMGNIVGSNIMNIAVILGLTAVLYPIRVRSRILRREIPLMIGATVVAVLLAADGAVGRLDAVLLLAAFTGYLALAFGRPTEDVTWLEREYEEYETAEAMTPGGESPWWDVGLVVLGVAGLSGGAHLMVTSAVAIANTVGVSELVIGLTVVSIGTSLPELATVLVAAFRQEADIALGNAVGSNVFNVLAILGIASLIRPVPVPASAFTLEIPVMLAVSVALLPFAWTRLKLERWEGAVLLASYIVFTWVLFARATGDGPSYLGW